MEIALRRWPEDLLLPPKATEIVERAARMVGEMYDLKDDEVSLTLTNNAYIHELNLKYRQIDRPTDVLSFALQEAAEPEILGGSAASILGDIVISVERAEEQAADFGHSLERELSFLTVHGMLHLLGYDHLTEPDREEMEAEQRAVMERLSL